MSQVFKRNHMEDEGYRHHSETVEFVWRKVLGENIHRRCVRSYDYAYGILVSDKSIKIRHALRRYVGARGEQALSKAVYGVFSDETADRRG